MPNYRDDRERSKYRDGPRNIEMDQKWLKVYREQAPGDISGTTGHSEVVHLSKFAEFYEEMNVILILLVDLIILKIFLDSAYSVDQS